MPVKHTFNLLMFDSGGCLSRENKFKSICTFVQDAYKLEHEHYASIFTDLSLF